MSEILNTTKEHIFSKSFTISLVGEWTKFCWKIITQFGSSTKVVPHNKLHKQPTRPTNKERMKERRKEL